MHASIRVGNVVKLGGARAISQWIGVTPYGLQTIGKPKGRSHCVKAMQHLIPYSENMGYVSNLRCFLKFSGQLFGTQVMWDDNKSPIWMG